jgi:serine/threonine protein kinase
MNPTATLKVTFTITPAIREVFDRRRVPRAAFEVSNKVLMPANNMVETVKARIKMTEQGYIVKPSYNGKVVNRTAAAMRLCADGSRAHRADFQREAFIRANLGVHANVVNCLGVQFDSPPEYIFVDYCSRGNLRTLLRTPKTNKDVGGHDMIMYAVQLAEGMKFLATNNIVHRNFSLLATAVEESEVVKVGDFSCARCAFPHSNLHSRMPLDPRCSLEASRRVTNGIPLG